MGYQHDEIKSLYQHIDELYYQGRLSEINELFLADPCSIGIDKSLTLLLAAQYHIEQLPNRKLFFDNLECLLDKEMASDKVEILAGIFYEPSIPKYTF